MRVRGNPVAGITAPYPAIRLLATPVPVLRSSMIEVQKFRISKEDFGALPPEERSIIFLSGHTLNALSAWIKILRFSSNHKTDRPVEAMASAAQSQVILRSLLGVLVEAWEWQKRPETMLLVGRKYLDVMPTEAREAYADLKKHFGASGMLHKIRNRFSYHYPNTADLVAAFDQTPADEDWSWYVSDEYTNSLYLSCELVIGRGVFNMMGEQDYEMGHTKLLHESMAVANAMNTFLIGLITEAVKANFPVRPSLIHEMEIENAMNGNTFSIPFYFESI